MECGKRMRCVCCALTPGNRRSKRLLAPEITLGLRLLPVALLLAVAPCAWAQAPLPDAVPPAVLGRPLEQIDPARPAKQAVDDRADPRMRSDDVGKGTRFARKPLAPGAYFSERHRIAVRKYYAQHPVRGAAANWKIGEPVPRGARLKPVPKGLLARLPALPPGHRYVQLGGEVVLIAAGSKMVVDGISRRVR